MLGTLLVYLNPIYISKVRDLIFNNNNNDK